MDSWICSSASPLAGGNQARIRCWDSRTKVLTVRETGGRVPLSFVSLFAKGLFFELLNILVFVVFN